MTTNMADSEETPATDAPQEAEGTATEAAAAAEETPPAEVQQEAATEATPAPQEAATADAAPPTEETAPAEGEDQPPAATQEATPEAEAQAADGEAPATEGEAPAPEGEATPAQEGEASAPEGEAPATEGDGATVEGGTGQATEEPTPEGEQEGAPEGQTAEGQPEGEGAEATEVTEGQEGQPPAEGEAQAAVEGEGEPKPEGEDGQPAEAGDNEGKEAAGAEGGEGTKSPVPQSDTFAEGERPESPVAVGQKLSREGSPVAQPEGQEETLPDTALVPGTPDRAGSLVEGEEEEEEEYDFEEDMEPEFDREQLIEHYHEAIAKREQLQQQNYQLQHKLAEYFRKKKSDESRQDVDKNVTDQEQRYLKYMANLDELRRQDADERESFKMQIEELKERCAGKQEHVDEERDRFMDFKKQIALHAINSRSGKPIPPRDIEQYMAQESRKEKEVVNIRLENIKLKNKLRKKEQQLKSKEELAEGLHLIDFEQLKIENQTYNEKIEERNEELLKLRKKITSTVQVLTHLKEKLQFVQAENQVQKVKLREVEEKAAKKRDILSRTKQARDALRIDNQRLRQNCGLLGNEPLLRDFEERKDEGDDLRDRLGRLQMTHAELTLHCSGILRKIHQAKAGRN